MARPYPDKFEREISPLSPQSGGSQTPISYSANVNRQKTKKWVEAKPADYGGDDWGDDYVDYSAPPPPLPKTTGLRQPGQVSQSPSSGGFPNAEGNKKAYGDLPSLPNEAQVRSVTNPVRDRANSFTRDDDRRAFSGGYAQPPVPNQAPTKILSQGEPVLGPSTSAQSNHPPTLQVSTQVPAVTGLRKAAQPNSPAAAQPPQGAVRGTQVDEPQSGTSSKYSEATSKYSEMKTPSSDFQARRDFSPSAVPPPLQARYSPTPQSAATDSPSSRFPPRKSSISQPVPPEVFQQPQPAEEVNTPKPWTGARSSSPGAAARSPATAGKGLPFIRPADIYRRMEEEREKERQSMDSSRPSMESIVGGNAGEQPSAPAKPPMRGQSSSESLGGSFNKGAIQESEDKVDSSRRMAPMLEPVQERKSEYGFEGYKYNPAQAMASPEEKTDFAAPKESQAGLLSHEEMRRFSTSPKLPDLNRISGFGLDLFSQSSANETSFQDSVLKSIPESSPSTNQNDSSLHTQPSLGFTSAIKQAFNAESSSNPDTPASVASSGVQRTGSESTSTAGISPIMSRLPSATPANTLNRELEARETATPSTAEVYEPGQSQGSPDVVANVPERQVTPLSNKDIEESDQRSARPIRHSNISTPSPRISPARTPNVKNTEKFPSALEGHISTTPDPAVSPVEEELSAPTRPFAERELSFRPNLPGGWVSYTTSTTDSTAEKEPRENQRAETYNQHIDPMDVPVSPISESGEDDIDIELTPATAKRPLPQSALDAGAGAAFGGVVAATFGGRDREMVNSSSGNDTSIQGPHVIPGNSTLPTPDPALAPIGNPYSASTLYPQLQDVSSASKSVLPKLELPTHGTTSTTSTKPPTPPPKDIPADEPVRDNPESFPPTAPLKHKTLDEVAATEGLVIPLRPQMLPTLSTQTSPQDEESDKLRKEIIKSLSPNVSDAEAGQRLAPPEVPDNNDTEDSTAIGARESTYLPSEYDNYWESTNEAEVQPLERDAKAEESGLKQELEKHQLTPKSAADIQETGESTPHIPPLSRERAERVSMEMPLQKPTLPSNRFSWVPGPEEVSSTVVPVNTQLQVPSPGIDPRYAATADSQLRRLEQTRETYFEQGSISTSGKTPAPETTPVIHLQEDTRLNSASPSNDQRKSDGQMSSHSHTESNAAIAALGVTGTTAYAVHQINQHDVSQRRLSLAEEKNSANASTYAVSPTPPENEHPALVSQPVIPPSVSEPLPSGQFEGHEPVTMFRSQQTSDFTKILQFKDILAFQNPEQRIRAYNDTRDQFAKMDIGLAEWLMVLSSNQRDSFPAGSWAGPVTASNGVERPKVLKSSPSGTPLQQPYYQQYLNASPTSSVPSMARPSTGITSGSQQGFSPSGGKQSKGKDLLHSAGVFGGKASKAGKGFFAKGKNKLRGSGGGDKDSPPLEASPAQPKPKVNERSSWNMSLSSLALPRSSARTSTPSQHSREASPPPQRQSQQDTETLPVVTPQRSSQLGTGVIPAITTGQTELSIWDAPVSAASTPPIQHATPQPSTNNENNSSRYVGSNHLVSKEEEEQDMLGVPAPIGKHQPSWDPYNATPIVEEDGFQYEERSSKQPSAIPPAVHHLDAPRIPIDAKSDRPASGDAPFFDGPEQPADADDWVIISKENIPKPSELSFATPVALQSNAMTQSNSANQPPARLQSSGTYQAPAVYQPRPGFQPVAGHQPPVGYQLPAGYQPPAAQQPPVGYQPPAGYQLPAGYQHTTGFQPSAGPPATSQPTVTSQPPAASQPQTSSQGGFRGRFIQHIRQRSSKDGNMPVASQPSTPPAVTKTKQLQLVEENKIVEKRPTEFVGLPPIRRSSTFGLGFRTKDPNKRFPLDEEEDDIRQKPSGASTSERDAINQRKDIDSVAPTVSQVGATDRFDSRVSGVEVAFGATAITAAVGDRMNQPSGEPSRYSAQDVKPMRAPDENQQRPALSNVSSEYSRPSSFSPVSPPLPSPVSPPGSRPAFTGGALRESVGPTAGRQVNTQQIHAGQDRQPDAEWRPNAGISQEQGTAPPTSYQRSPPTEVHQSASQVPPMAVHPRHPPFDEQRPANPPSHAREPSFEGQRVRSPSTSSQGNIGTLPILSRGVFVSPPRAGSNQQKPFDQPPSSAQRYPALFRAEHGGKESSVDGLPAHYYQAPISKEDAFLPRQQTNEYQLPGVGPPPDQPQSGKRNSKRNSALFKELGGRLSRSTSQDRDSTIDDDAWSPMRPVESRDSQTRNYSAASITSEDTVEKKKRKSGLSFFGTRRRESTGGPPQSRDSMITHLPGSRTDLLIQPQLQQPSSPLVPPDKRKLFSNSNRSTTDPEKSKQSKLLRASTSSVMAEQPGKKKRFSGIASMFSKPSTEQQRRGSSVSAGQAPQDSRNYQQPAPLAQEPQYLEYPAQQTTQEPRRFQEVTRPMGRGSPSPQAPPQNRQDHDARSPGVSGYVGQSTSQPIHIAQSSQGPQRQESPAGRVGLPLPSPSLVNPTLQHSVIETRPIQDRHISQQYGPNLQSPQSYQRQTAGVAQTGPLPQPATNSLSPQTHQRQASGVIQPSPDLRSQQSHQQQTSGLTQPGPISQPVPNSQSPLNRPLQTSVASPSSPLPQSVPNLQSPPNRLQLTPAVIQPGPLSQPVTNSQSLQSSQSRPKQPSLGTQPVPLSQPPTSQSPGQFTENRASYQQGPPAAGGGQLNLLPLQVPQQTQFQQRVPGDSQQVNLRPAASPQVAPRTNQERQPVLTRQSPVQVNQTRAENKQRQGSTTRLLSGLIGGRRSSGQQGKDTADVRTGKAPQMANTQQQQQQQQQQQRQPQLQQQPPQQWQQQQQQVSPNSQLQGISGQNQQQGRPMNQEPQYDPLPIPNAYNLVRGEGGRLVPTPYDPRGLNAQPGPHGNQQSIYRDQAHAYPPRPPQIQIQPYPNDQYVSMNHSNAPQIAPVAPQNTNIDMRPGLDHQQNSQNSNKSTRPLSNEDLVARSPARPQFGQQAPYQLSLPDENAGNDERDRPLPADKNLPSERQPSLGGKLHMEKVPPTERSLPVERKFPPAGNINTNQQAAGPSLRHPLSPATYPLPENAPFSPINPKADQIPPPPPPKWPQQAAASQNLDRSNTINTHASEVSQISGGQLSVPGPSKPKEQERPTSVTPPSPQVTPERSPEQVSRHMAPRPQEEDVYSASPRHSVVVIGSATTASEAPQQSPEKILVEGRDSQNARRRTSQEEKILVEEGMVRPGSAQEEIPSMSATSYPGQEWHPYGNGYEDWD